MGPCRPSLASDPSLPRLRSKKDADTRPRCRRRLQSQLRGGPLWILRQSGTEASIVKRPVDQVDDGGWLQIRASIVLRADHVIPPTPWHDVSVVAGGNGAGSGCVEIWLWRGERGQIDRSRAVCRVTARWSACPPGMFAPSSVTRFQLHRS